MNAENELKNYIELRSDISDAKEEIKVYIGLSNKDFEILQKVDKYLALIISFYRAELNIKPDLGAFC